MALAVILKPFFAQSCYFRSSKPKPLHDDNGAALFIPLSAETLTIISISSSSCLTNFGSREGLCGECWELDLTCRNQAKERNPFPCRHISMLTCPTSEFKKYPSRPVIRCEACFVPIQDHQTSSSRQAWRITSERRSLRCSYIAPFFFLTKGCHGSGII